MRSVDVTNSLRRQQVARQRAQQRRQEAQLRVDGHDGRRRDVEEERVPCGRRCV
jgi:hypothetical protein